MIIDVQTAEALALFDLYESHKVVFAAKVLGYRVDEANKTVTFRFGFQPELVVADSDRFKQSSSDLGYVVSYNDGYISWSPTKAFEEGYTRIPRPAETQRNEAG